MTEADVIQPSASIASTGKGIRYIGKEHCYAYSGGFGASTTPTEWLSFRTGSGIIVGVFQLNTPVKAITPLDMSGIVAVIKLNGNTVCHLVANPQGSPEVTGESFVTQSFILPPLTEFTAEVTSDADDADDIGSALFTGRVYGAT